MNLDQMLYLTELGKTKTISQAAKNLNISQAGLSQSLDKLEEELGLRLFNRTRSGITITEAGKQVVAHAKAIENQLGLIRQYSTQQRTVVDPPLRFGVMNEVPNSLLNWLLQFQDQHSQFKAYLQEASSIQIIKGVKTGDYDAGLIAINKAHFALLEELDFTEVGQGQFKLYMTPNHYLADHPDPIPISLIREQEFALFIDDYISEYVGKIEQRYGALNIIMQSTSFRIVLETMKKFQAVSIIRNSQLHNRLYNFEKQAMVEHNLDMFDFKDDQAFRYGIIRRPGKQLTNLQTQFVTGIGRIQ